MYIHKGIVFTWDPEKAESNRRKHAVGFDKGASVFLDPKSLDWEDLRHSGFEVRRRRLGLSSDREALLVAYTTRRFDHGEETIRIISCRPASRKERKALARQQD